MARSLAEQSSFGAELAAGRNDPTLPTISVRLIRPRKMSFTSSPRISLPRASIATSASAALSRANRWFLQLIRFKVAFDFASVPSTRTQTWQVVASALVLPRSNARHTKRSAARRSHPWSLTLLTVSFRRATSQATGRAALRAAAFERKRSASCPRPWAEARRQAPGQRRPGGGVIGEFSYRQGTYANLADLGVSPLL